MNLMIPNILANMYNLIISRLFINQSFLKLDISLRCEKMDHLLIKPVKEKHSALDHNERLLYGSSAMQGWRVAMEDTHTLPY